MPHIIRPLGEKDIEPIHALGISEPAFCFEEEGFWSEEQLAAWFKSPVDVCVGAFRKKSVLGFALVAVHAPTRKAVLENFLVEKDPERDIIAYDLHNEMVRRLEQRGVTQIQFLIEAQRRAVRRYFEQFDFRATGTFVSMNHHLRQH